MATKGFASSRALRNIIQNNLDMAGASLTLPNMGSIGEKYGGLQGPKTGSIGERYCKHNSCIFWHFSCDVYGHFIEMIGLKAPGDYFASIWYNNNYSICLWENPKTVISMIL